MLNFLKKEANMTLTENGGTSFRSSESFCLDMFFRAGAMRNSSEEEIANTVIRAYAEDPDKTMKTVFFARDARGGLGERRFFRCAISALVDFAPESVRKNIPLFAEYGRYDDLCILLGTELEKDAAGIIITQLQKDIKAMHENQPASLLAKWLPSVNASSKDTRNKGRRMASLLGMSEPMYRKTLSALRKYTDILENRLRERDYTFNYEVQPSCAMFKYRSAFIRNDGERYTDYLNKVNNGEAKLNAGRLYPYDIVRAVLKGDISAEERLSLDTAWKALLDLTAAKGENALAVIDGSGSMTWGIQNNIQTIFFLNILFPECVCGFRKRKSYYDFLIPHVTNNKSRYYLRLDISNFFDSIRVDDVKECLSYYFIKDIPDDEKEWIINTIIDIATYNNKVIQGAITSPILSNLVFRSLDIRIEKYCDKMGIKYTRYADDLLFSSDTSYIHNYKFQNMIKTILSSKGFELNNIKTLKFQNEISLNGYVVGTNIRLSRKKLTSLNTILFAMKNNKFKGFKSRKAMYIAKNKLAGYRAFLIQSIPYLSEDKTNQVKKKIMEIETLISKYCIEK